MACGRVNFNLLPFTIITFIFMFYMRCIPVVKHLCCKIFLACCCCCCCYLSRGRLVYKL